MLGIFLFNKYTDTNPKLQEARTGNYVLIWSGLINYVHEDKLGKWFGDATGTGNSLYATIRIRYDLLALAPSSS